MSLLKFIDDSPLSITNDNLEFWESMTGKTVYPGQLDRLLIDQQAYRETLVRAGINDAARQNLLAFSRAPVLDYLGELQGVFRLPAQAATCDLEVVFRDPTPEACVLRAGTRFESNGGMRFILPADKFVPRGGKTVSLLVQAAEPGPAGNGYSPGRIRSLPGNPADAPPYPVESVSNTSTSRGGLEKESDDRLRERIGLAPERYSWGSEGRYRFEAMTAAPEISDVRCASPKPDGSVLVALLSYDGVPGYETVNKVQAALTAKDKRMLGDRVTVMAAEPVPYSIRLELELFSGCVPELVLAEAENRCREVAGQCSARLGHDLVPKIIITALRDLPGLYDLELVEPVERQVLEFYQWPELQQLSVVLKGLVNGS